MKKIVLIMMFCIILSGCTGKEKEKENVNNKIISNIDLIQIEEISEFKDLVLLTDDAIDSEIGINVYDVDNYIGKYSYPFDSKFYLVIKPKESKKDNIDKAVLSYIDSLINRISLKLDNPDITEEETAIINKKIEMLNNMVKEEYNGYLIYISSENNDKILKIIKENL